MPWCGRRRSPGFLVSPSGLSTRLHAVTFRVAAATTTTTGDDAGGETQATDGPVVLSIPDVGDRYVSFQLTVPEPAALDCEWLPPRPSDRAGIWSVSVSL